MQIRNCKISEVLDFLSDDNVDFSFQEQSIRKLEKGYKINIVKQLENRALLGYINSRGVSSKIGEKYCKEIYYSLNDKKYFAIAFKNNSNGYEIRNKYFKGALGKKDITTIDVGSSCVNIFEGFFDFISHCQIYSDMKFENAIILNSISNVQKAIPSLYSYNKVQCFLDNDNRGVETTNFSNWIKTVKSSELCEAGTSYQKFSERLTIVNQYSFHFRYRERNNQSIALR